ncbi:MULTISPECIES: hypothetical protein [Acidiphilium]|uniref:Invasion protein IalB, involved in pathogenesis n=1 Tax=Acidiphilium rubrum TaxID=526 RepID=A0A8G2CIC7_ACIRU|nr:MULTISPECIES: hypothetical protein [Acidiphilium]SIQ22768.1 hypothetical protein SAMN05421828_102268 [Acidiphilium rubrum]
MRHAFLKKATLIAGFYLFSSQVALAQWGARVQGPDVFGATTVVAATGNSSEDGLVIQCDNKHSLYIAYIIPGRKSELNEMSQADSGIPVTLLMKIDSNPVVKFKAELKMWNNTYLGIVTSGRRTKLFDIIKSLATAKTNVSVGADLMGSKQSDTFGVSGSTAAMSTVTKDCALNNIKPDPSNNNKS